MISMHMQDLKDPLRWHNKPIRNTLSQRTLGKKKKEKRSSGLHSTAERQISVCAFGLIYMVCPENPKDICTYSISLCICSLHSLGAQISVPVLRWLSTFSSLAENFYYYNALRKCVQRFRDLPLRFPSELLLLFFPFFNKTRSNKIPAVFT